jgi:hypothetical protein
MRRNQMNTTAIAKVLSAPLAAIYILFAGATFADLPELFFDDFDDGNYDGWVADSPYFDIFAPPDLLPSPEGYAVWGVGQGYGQDDGLSTALSHPLNLSNVAELAIEMRATTGPGWPSAAQVDLYQGTQDYYGGFVQGEGERQAAFLIMEDGAGDQWTYTYGLDDEAYNWHDYRWERDADGWWSFYLDGALIAANYHQHSEFADFDWLELYPLRSEAAIEWVRIRGNIVPTPGSLAILALGTIGIVRRSRPVS